MTEQEKKKTANLEDVQAFGRIIHNKGIGSEGTCTTAAGTAAKTVTVGTTFSPVAGATLLVTFQNAITVASATLAVTYGPSGSTATLAAKPIYYRGAALGAGLVKAGATLLLRYDGTRFNIVGDLDTDTNTVTDVSYDSANKKLTKTVGGTTTDIATAVKIVEDGGGLRLNPLDLLQLPHDYVFNLNDALIIGGHLYRCTVASTTAPPFNFVFDDNNRIIYEEKNGQITFVVGSDTLNANWQDMLDLTDRFYTEQRIDLLTRQTDHPYVTCTTAGSTAAKEVYFNGFVLAANRTVSVLFTNGFATTNSTLNISGTGAKAIKYFGENIAPGKVRDNTILNMTYDGTAWNVFSITSLAGTPGMAVDLGLPSGLLWCDRNVGADSPEGEGLYFAWGFTTGHKANTSYIFTQSNYNSTSAASISSDLSLAYDGARSNLGSPWRMPSKEEVEELFANCIVEEFTMNGTSGFLFTSRINSNSIFLPESGGLIGSLDSQLQEVNVKIYGCCLWTNKNGSNNYAWSVQGLSGNSIELWNEERYRGYQIRAVM